MGRRREKRALERALKEARSYDAWRRAAEALDRHEGHDAWRADPASPYFDRALLIEDLHLMEAAVETGTLGELPALLAESIYRHLPDLMAPELYAVTRSGETKQIVQRYLTTCARIIGALIDTPVDGWSDTQKREELQRRYDNFGRSALMLSGGATWGLYHMGVCKALHENGLIPSVVCGSSMGAIIAAGICTRSPEELDQLFGDVASIHRVCLRPFSPREMWRSRALMDPEQLREHITFNCGDDTFAEAYARTGRTLAISISPTRARQKPRVLTHRTAPQVRIVDATLASCAVPGLFPPVQLSARTAEGEVVPYAPNETWVDGSLQGDLPMDRLGRLHNVNHFIVSQTNPHVVPLLGSGAAGPRGALLSDLGVAVARAQASAVLDTVRRRVRSDTLRSVADHLHGLAAQRYAGDILIHPSFEPGMLARVLKNPSLEQLEGFIRDGERATWPHLAQVRDQTLLSRTFEALLR